jgi:hypothetical protein
MPSPFPGMNPYLEQEGVWQDFHQSWIPAVRAVLREQIRPGYLATIEEALFIHERSSEERLFLGRSDVSVTRNPASSGVRSTSSLLEAPAHARIPVAVDVERHSYVEIRDRHNRELVTVVELLSPSSKRTGPDREQYLAKRRQILASSVHLVEIDLLRGGPRLPLDDLPDCNYYALVSRAEERPDVAVWPLRLRERLPEIPIPLRTPDPAAHLDLQEVLHRVYDAAGYEDYIYTGTPQPPLHPADAAWAQQLIPAPPPA